MTPNVVDLAEYRRRYMAGKGAAARGYVSQPKKENADAAERKTTKAKNVKLSDETWEAWGFWCAQMQMTYDASIRFLLEHHAIDIRVPAGIRVKGKAEKKED